MSYRSFKRVLGETSLERKCRILFGVCLALLIAGSFWWYGSRAEEIVYEKHGAESLDLHHRNLMGAIRTGDALKCDVTLAYKGVVACEMGVRSFRERRYMAWDKAKEKIVKT